MELEKDFPTVFLLVEKDVLAADVELCLETDEPVLEIKLVNIVYSRRESLQASRISFRNTT